MSYTVTKYPAGTFSWVDMFSAKPEETKKFLTELFGWTSKDMPTPQGVDYTMFYKNGKSVSAMSPIPESMKGMPPHFNSYVSVEDVDAAVAKAKELGGTITMQAMDVMDAGRMAGIQDPAGAHFEIWQAGKHIGAELVNTVGANGWNELYTNDLEAVQKFYGDLFGWTFEQDDTGYVVIKNNGRMNGGMMQIQEDWGDMPSLWMPYFTIANAEETKKKVIELGGKVDGEIIPAQDIGKFIKVIEPSGAMFIAIELTTEADHWEE